MTALDKSKMNIVERASYELHALYRKFGYSRYKMDKFEEYELYLGNRDFIESESIIAFSDASGRLMALKPDLTLSIVKNYRYTEGFVQKLFYSENIYRSSKEDRTHKEIMQTGLECMGDIDGYQLAEVTALAAESLDAVAELAGTDYVLQISHMGIIADILSGVRGESVKRAIINCIGEKNMHELTSICSRNGIGEETVGKLRTLVSTYGDPGEVLPALGSLGLSDEGTRALGELSGIFALLEAKGLSGKARIDFSIVNDMTYYSGLLFQGFIEGVPKSVLSGGRYDRLMERMGKKGGALGFAVYLDYLNRLVDEKGKVDADLLVLYEEGTDPVRINEEIKKLAGPDETVLVEKAVPAGMTFGRTVRI